MDVEHSLPELLGEAHAAHADRRFDDADRLFTRAAEQGQLAAGDVVAWGDAAWWIGHADRALALAEQGHQQLLAEGQTTWAAKEAINLGFLLMMRGDLAAGSGWLQRGRSLLQRDPDIGAVGYIRQLDAESALRAGDLVLAATMAREAQEAGRRGCDETLVSMALMTQGTAQLWQGDLAAGMALLDEAMLAVTTRRVAPEVAGNLYCKMIAICWELADLRRAREWTLATEQWCLDFDRAVMFSGICRMHRVQLRQVAGEWDDAAAQARVVCTELDGMNVSTVAEGHYLLGDVLRLQGKPDEAEAAYRRAHELGREPQPGRALLRARLGDTHAALVSLQTALATNVGAEFARAPLLRAVVEVALLAKDLEVARSASEQLRSIAERWGSDGLRAVSANAQGEVLFATGDAGAALPHLRDAVRGWTELEAPYDGARARLLLADVLEALGDRDAAGLERDAGTATLNRIKAVAELERLARLTGKAPGGLTPREAEILTAVADGRTNRQVADALVISEKTVARHLANIYLKIRVTTRTAAADWARRNGLHPST